MFDPAGVRLSPGALDGAEPLKPHSFELDTSGCGVKGDLQLDIVHDKRSVMCALEKLSATKYRATFMPKAPGKHRVSIILIPNIIRKYFYIYINYVLSMIYLITIHL